MNNPTPVQPRRWCRVLRGWSMLKGDSPHGLVARHIAHCADCQAYFAAATTLDDRLRHAAKLEERPLPPGFEARMQRALAGAMREPARPEPAVRWGWWSLAGGAVAAAAVLALVFMRPDATPRNVTQIAEVVPPATPSTTGQVILDTINENPLEQEIVHVYADARAALQFLALNFLPSSATSEDAPPRT